MQVFISLMKSMRPAACQSGGGANRSSTRCHVEAIKRVYADLRTVSPASRSHVLLWPQARGMHADPSTALHHLSIPHRASCALTTIKRLLTNEACAVCTQSFFFTERSNVVCYDRHDVWGRMSSLLHQLTGGACDVRNVSATRINVGRLPAGSTLLASGGTSSGSAAPSASTNASMLTPKQCMEVRQLFREDALLWDAHCRDK